ncbi:hypothetical protein ACI2CH_08850 [Campylobacter jejuni]|uniref:hypothetical protein n=1 Tax=Campylobacter coli TaxID=195 RepID=UPI0029323998|nr:hypothetical protein [Campylobacter jejuni]HEF2263974.1 hypothetical protein [Campylobacter jejuni]HEF2265664.1 hypothetical protein [Campylobacter jejuni]HEF2320698.1 hypothetical protein [Campylobacter jejuni]HEG6413415.1 hypothetical protein [Campylobacter jejuni]
MENKEINKECLEFIAFLKDENTKEFSGNIRVKKRTYENNFNLDFLDGTLKANKDFKYSDEKAEELYNYIRFLHYL